MGWTGEKWRWGGTEVPARLELAAPMGHVNQREPSTGRPVRVASEEADTKQRVSSEQRGASPTGFEPATAAFHAMNLCQRPASGQECGEGQAALPG